MRPDRVKALLLPRNDRITGSYEWNFTAGGILDSQLFKLHTKSLHIFVRREILFEVQKKEISAAAHVDAKTGRSGVIKVNIGDILRILDKIKFPKIADNVCIQRHSFKE